MAFIGESDRVALRKRFGALTQPVRLLVFTDGTDRDGCRLCAQTADLAQELAALDARLQVDVIDRAAQPGRAARYGIDKVPAIAVLAPASSSGQTRTDPIGPDAGFRDTGIRFFGIPAGYEFSALVEAAISASSGGAALAPETERWLASLDRPLHVQVFVTPTCPYCPRAVHLAHRLALASPPITGDMVEASEFPELADRYGVMGVPRTVINETTAVEGAVPEGYLLEYLKQAAAAG
jgi:glutaredoxin-like protein